MAMGDPVEAADPVVVVQADATEAAASPEAVGAPAAEWPEAVKREAQAVAAAPAGCVAAQSAERKKRARTQAARGP